MAALVRITLLRVAAPPRLQAAGACSIVDRDRSALLYDRLLVQLYEAATCVDLRIN